jgi:asparagine N-glycosylation enzyme membrane subunit Stt3
MTNEPEWRDANPATADLPNKGRTVIFCLVGGLALGVLSFVGMRIRPVGLAVGGFAFFSGIGMLLRRRRQKASLKPAVIITAAGFLMLAANPRFGMVAPFAGYCLITGAIGLVVFGLIKAVKLAWDLGNRS